MTTKGPGVITAGKEQPAVITEVVGHLKIGITTDVVRDQAQVVAAGSAAEEHKGILTSREATMPVILVEETPATTVTRDMAGHTNMVAVVDFGEEEEGDGSL